MRKQEGQIIRIGERWYIRYWERRVANGALERKRVTHELGPITTKGKHPPGDIVELGAEHMATVNGHKIPAEQILTIGEFVEGVYLPWVKDYKRPSTYNGYKDIWNNHLKPRCAKAWMKNVRTFTVQQLLDDIAREELSRNSLKHIKSVISAIFKRAKQLNYFHGENPARDTGVSPAAPEAQETYAYSLEEVQTILAVLPEPAATAFAVAAFMGLRHGEIQGLLWENYHDGELHITRSIWNGHATGPKTRGSSKPVPVIRHLAERLELHRMRDGNPQSGPIFRNSLGRPLCLNNVLGRQILPALNRCASCRKSEDDHRRADHEFERDARYPEWHGWHAARRGLGSNLYRLGVPDKVIQQILRHANVSTTMAYYVKGTADDVRKAMETLENNVPKPPLNFSGQRSDTKTPSGEIAASVN